jgi:hypothetical protein
MFWVQGNKVMSAIKKCMYVFHESKKNYFTVKMSWLYLDNINKNGLTFQPPQNKGLLIKAPLHGQTHRCPDSCILIVLVVPGSLKSRHFKYGNPSFPRPQKRCVPWIRGGRILMGMIVDMNVYTDTMNKTNQIGYTNAYAKLRTNTIFSFRTLFQLGKPPIPDLSDFDK